MKIHYGQIKKTILDVKEDKRTEVQNFGKGNDFPSVVEALINASVTSKICVDKVSKAISGAGFGELGEVVVNNEGQTLNEVLRIASREYAKHNNLFIHVGYNLNHKFSFIKVLPSSYCRVGKSDDKNYSGKIVIYDNWDKSKGTLDIEGFNVVDCFNDSVDVVESQINAVGGIKNYKGQLLHIKKDSSYTYSLSDITTVQSDALQEYNSQTFRCRGSEEGFLNTKVVVIPEQKEEKTSKKFIESLNGTRGAENSSKTLVIEASGDTEDLSKQIFVADLTSPYNDKLFSYSDIQAEKEICKAFNVPLILVSPSDKSIFGNSGALLREAKIQLYETKKEERMQIESVFSSLMSNFVKPVTSLSILNPFAETEEPETEDTTAQAQATLRGSVGGVTALLAIQQSVSAQTTTRDAGVAMIVNIFGFSKEQAIEMLGEPKLIVE